MNPPRLVLKLIPCGVRYLISEILWKNIVLPAFYAVIFTVLAGKARKMARCES